MTANCPVCSTPQDEGDFTEVVVADSSTRPVQQTNFQGLFTKRDPHSTCVTMKDICQELNTDDGIVEKMNLPPPNKIIQFPGRPINLTVLYYDTRRLLDQTLQEENIRRQGIPPTQSEPVQCLVYWW